VQLDEVGHAALEDGGRMMWMAMEPAATDAGSNPARLSLILTSLDRQMLW
jgi:hypothetical protein